MAITKYDKLLSVLCPGIRPHNWFRLYESVKNSLQTDDFEIVFVGPCDPPKELENNEHIKYIRDFGNPVRCRQIALLRSSKSKYVAWATDDGYFLSDCLLQAIKLLDNKGEDDNIVSGIYLEGLENEISPGERLNKEYWKINYHGACNSVYSSEDWYLINIAIMKKPLLLWFGGWDAFAFECTAMADADLSNRVQRKGINVLLYEKPMFYCEQFVGPTGDHAPVHYAQIDHDEKIYREIYSNPNCQSRVWVDPNLWEKVENTWRRRDFQNLPCNKIKFPFKMWT